MKQKINTSMIFNSVLTADAIRVMTANYFLAKESGGNFYLIVEEKQKLPFKECKQIIFKDIEYKDYLEKFKYGRNCIKDGRDYYCRLGIMGFNDLNLGSITPIRLARIFVGNEDMPSTFLAQTIVNQEKGVTRQVASMIKLPFSRRCIALEDVLSHKRTEYSHIHPYKRLKTEDEDELKEVFNSGDSKTLKEFCLHDLNLRNMSSRYNKSPQFNKSRLFKLKNYNSLNPCQL